MFNFVSHFRMLSLLVNSFFLMHGLLMCSFFMLDNWLLLLNRFLFMNIKMTLVVNRLKSRLVD